MALWGDKTPKDHEEMQDQMATWLRKQQELAFREQREKNTMGKGLQMPSETPGTPPPRWAMPKPTLTWAGPGSTSIPLTEADVEHLVRVRSVIICEMLRLVENGQIYATTEHLPTITSINTILNDLAPPPQPLDSNDAKA